MTFSTLWHGVSKYKTPSETKTCVPWHAFTRVAIRRKLLEFEIRITIWRCGMCFPVPQIELIF